MPFRAILKKFAALCTLACRVETLLDAQVSVRVPTRQAEARATQLRITVALHGRTTLVRLISAWGFGPDAQLAPYRAAQ